MSLRSNADPLPHGLHPQARIGIRLFNAGEYYRAHDHLELAWRDSPGEEGVLYQGILQVGIAYYHIQRGNDRGALKMFHRARQNLTVLPGEYLGIDLEQLQADAKLIEKQIWENNQDQKYPQKRLTFPKVPLK